MTRIPMKSSMYAVLMMASMLIFAATLAFGAPQLGTAIGPGVGGQVHSFAFDPANPNVFYAGGDVCGVYKYDKTNGKWTPWSNGLGLNEIGRAFYVDDLLVVRGLTGDGEANNGVYAATQGGLWFRRGDSSRWVCVSKKADGNYATYDKGYAYGVLHYSYDATHPALQKIPFASLAFDADTGMLYAGAGSARVGGTKNFYPRTNYPQTGSPGNPPDDEYALWQMNLNSPAPSISTVEGSQGITGCGYGYARQVAVVAYTDSYEVQHRVVAAACESKVFIKEVAPASAPCQTIWPVSSADKSILGESISEEPWGVAAGSRGRLYVSSRRDPSNGNLNPGVYVLDLKTNSWSQVSGNTGDLWLPNASPTTWIDFLRDTAGNPKRDLTELSVYPKASGLDEIFIGIGRVNADDYGDCGYVRCGNYNTTAAGDSKYGWAYVHYSKNSQILLADWQHLPIQANPMASDQIGWHRYYPKLQALVPFAIHPDPAHADIMVGIDYGIPMVSWNGSTSWSNLYCTGPDAGGGWQNIGLNLLCPRSSGLKSDGRLVIGAADYGVFRATTPLNDYFQMLHVPTTRGNPLDFPDAVDVEIVNNGGQDEIYMVDEIDDPDGKPETHENADIYAWPDVDGTQDWESVTDGIMTGSSSEDLTIPGARERLAIAEVAFISPNRMIAAVGAPTSDGGNHYYLREGSRVSGTAPWTWGKCLDVDIVAGSYQTKVITDLCAIPNTNKVLYSAKTKTYGSPAAASAGGVYVVDWGASPSSPLGSTNAWLGGTALTVSCVSDTCKLGKHVSALSVDPTGRYVYAGCSRPDGAWELGRGGVVRFELDAQGRKIDREILSGSDGGGWQFPLDLRALYTTDAAALQCWEWCTNVSDIAIDPNNPAICYVALNNHSYIDDETGVWRFVNGTWTHLWGGGELGAGAWTVDVSANGYTLFIGAVGQEYFTMPVPGAQMGPVPVVARDAECPMMHHASGQGTNVFAVHVGPPEGGGTVQSVVADARDLCNSAPGSVPLLDNGVAPDLIAGDGVYTSGFLTTHIGAVGEITVRVTAVGGDANYVVSNVRTPVISTAPAVAVTSPAGHAIWAGSTSNESTFAVKITSDAPVPTAYATICDGAGVCVRELRDNGQNGDDAAGDHIYTSAPFVAAGVSPVSALVSVMPISNYGASVPTAVTVDVVDSSAKFADVTASTGDLVGALSELPYSAIYFTPKPGDTSMKDVMVVTFDSDGSGKAPQILQRRDQPAPNGAPVFFNKTNDWMTNDLPSGSRGICYADYDNDGDMDFFICNPVSGGKLYRNRVNEGLGFRNATTAVFGADSTYVAHAITAAWGDYNADGFADLYVAGTSYFNSVQALTADALSASYGGGSGATNQEWVYHNRQGVGLARTGIGGPITSNLVLSACWADMDNDGDLDLITSRYILGAVRVWENAGYAATVGDNVFGETGWSMPTSDPDHYFGANSVTVFDENHDNYPDLVVTFATHDGNPKVKILRNRCGTGSKVFETYDLAHGVEWNGAAVADFDLDGQNDILLQPRVAGLVPALYLGRQYSQSAPPYVDAGYTLGLRGGVTGGAIAVDFDGEHNIDLYLGRSGGASARALYRNVGTAASAQRWLDVRLSTQALGQGSLMGTRVVVEADGHQWTRTVEGGGGRGGQSANRLLFGLGAGSSSATVTVYYPSGEVDGPTSVPLDGTPAVFEEDQAIAFPTTGRPTCSYELAPGQTDWVFKWRTAARRGDPVLDEVEVWNYSNYEPDGDCGVGIAAGGTKLLSWGDPGVEHSVHRVGTEWFHEVRWKALPCGTNCTYKFRVTSGMGAQSITSVWGPTTTNSFCVPDPGDPNQQ